MPEMPEMPPMPEIFEHLSDMLPPAFMDFSDDFKMPDLEEIKKEM